MKITIDLEDFWLDGEQDLEAGLKTFVSNHVLNEVKKSIDKKIEDHLTMKIREEIEKHMYRQMNSKIDEFIKVGQVKSSRDSSKTVTIEEYIKEKFTYDSGYMSASDTIKKLAQQFGQEFKNKYDLLFASQLVAKMNETGLLKKEAAKLLLDTK